VTDRQRPIPSRGADRPDDQQRPTGPWTQPPGGRITPRAHVSAAAPATDRFIPVTCPQQRRRREPAARANLKAPFTQADSIQRALGPPAPSSSPARKMADGTATATRAPSARRVRVAGRPSWPRISFAFLLRDRIRSASIRLLYIK